MFQYGKDETEYKKIVTEDIILEKFLDKKIITITSKILEDITCEAFYDISHFLRKRGII